MAQGQVILPEMMSFVPEKKKRQEDEPVVKKLILRLLHCLDSDSDCSPTACASCSKHRTTTSVTLSHRIMTLRRGRHRQTARKVNRDREHYVKVGGREVPLTGR